MYQPANPQFLQPGKTAPEGSPQTQFVVPSTDSDEVVKTAAAAALAAWEAAQTGWSGPVPPAGVYVGTEVRWQPAASVSQ